MTILAFHQCIVVATPGLGFGKFNAKFLQQFSHPVVHIFADVVAVKTSNLKRQYVKQLLQRQDQI